MAKRLGKGLDAFFSEPAVSDESIQEIPVGDCRPNPYQPRKTFNADSIEELKDSIIEYGIIQPLVVRRSIKGYEIVVGERRFRAAKEAGLKKVPVIIQKLSDHKMMELALLENLQREDLTPIEEAHAYENLMRELKVTQEELSRRLGKSRSHIANMVRLLALPKQLVTYINNGELSMGHGRALLGLKDNSILMDVVSKIQAENMNVRQVEKLINELNEGPKEKKGKQPHKDVFIKERESVLESRLGTGVNIHQGKRKGRIEIEFYSKDDLERIIEILEG